MYVMTSTNDTQPSATHYVLVDFDKIDISRITFGKVRQDKHGGINLPILYDDKKLYVKFRPMKIPFGIQKNMNDAGLTVNLSLPDDYRNDAYFLKAQELDRFFGEKCLELLPNIPRELVIGDEYGSTGMFKRILKFNFKRNPHNNAKTLLQYPPHFKMAVFHEGVKLYDQQGKEMNCDYSKIPNFSEISVIASFNSIHRGTYGCSVKPKVQQMRIYSVPESLLDRNELLI